MAWNPTHSITDNLKAFQKKRVAVHLRSGATLTGTIGEIGEHFVTIEQLEHREFFDALVRIDEIAALETRARAQ